MSFDLDHISLDNVTMADASESPPRILIYGPPGMGKTTLAAQFPNPIVLQTEKGMPKDAPKFATFGKLDSFAALDRALYILGEQDHDYQTVVLDSITAAQSLIFQETCEIGDENQRAKRNIEDFGYGKGYMYAQRVTEGLYQRFEYLHEHRNMAVVIIGHSKIEKFDDPENVSYDRFELDLHQKLRGIFERDMDAMFFLKTRSATDSTDPKKQGARVIGRENGDQIWLHPVPSGAYTAKNRLGMDKKFILKKDAGFDQLREFLPNWTGDLHD
jgi:DNA polymerase III delta prime subunit